MLRQFETDEPLINRLHEKLEEPCETPTTLLKNKVHEFIKDPEIYKILEGFVDHCLQKSPEKLKYFKTTLNTLFLLDYPEIINVIYFVLAHFPEHFEENAEFSFIPLLSTLAAKAHQNTKFAIDDYIWRFPVLLLTASNSPASVAQHLAHLDFNLNDQTNPDGNSFLLAHIAFGNFGNVNNILMQMKENSFFREKINLNLYSGTLGLTALHLITIKGASFSTSPSLIIAEKLIQLGADINCKTSAGGHTPLHLACLKQDCYLIKLLLDNGADPNIINTQGKKPIEMLSIGRSTAKTTITVLNGNHQFYFNNSPQDVSSLEQFFSTSVKKPHLKI